MSVKRQAAAKQETVDVVLSDRQVSVIENLTRAVHELQGRVQLYTAAIGDANDVPEGYIGINLDPKSKTITFGPAPQQGPQVVKD